MVDPVECPMTGQVDTPTTSDALLESIEDLERRLADLGAELDRSHRLATIGTLSGIIAHEFNNLMTPVLGYASSALREPGDADLTRKALERAIDGADKASRIASALLSFLSREEGAAASDTEYADVADVVGEALLCLARDPARDGIELAIDIEPGCRARIDPVSLQQVVLNLLLNAKQAMAPRGGRLEIRASTWTAADADSIPCSTWSAGTPAPRPPGASADTHSRVVRLDVQDTGSGIAPDRLDRVFDAFTSFASDPPDHAQREPATSSRGPGGTGLGLTICRRLIQDAGGSITLRSQLGSGTCFTIMLPAL